MPSRAFPQLRLVVVVAALSAATGCAAAVSPVQIEVAHTAARVKTALVNDPLVGARAIDVRVDAEGVVLLSGRVSSSDEANHAVQLARSVPGVTRVVTRFQVGAEPPAPAEPDIERRPDPRGPGLEFAELEDERTLLAAGVALMFSNDESAAGTRTNFWPIARLGSGPGLGPAFGFDWYDATPQVLRGAANVGHVRIRPIMGGVHYAMPMGRLSIVPSLVAGYAFNSLEVAEGGAAERLSVDVANSFAWRPAVSFWFEASRRAAVLAQVGRVVTSPRFTVVEEGRLRERKASADSTVVLVGVAYKFF
jgi:hypothetical protein